ncbi:collagen alpha-1(XXII) chain-like [Stylophora pistillata]|uniref:collagen alpha-1(XXII) chain-like n=1 Tax=Stylophora pistillata TaxID=50429 RepID=UPI000C04997F|nr:collagen alpha-1(XXII) chain-like [Stylophora pistillata]
MSCFLRLLWVLIQVLVIEVSCDFQNDRRLLEDYNKFQHIPSARTTSKKLQMHFLAQTDASRLKRQLRGHYDIIYIIDSSSSISRAEFQKGIKAIQMLIDRGAADSVHAAITVANQAHTVFTFTTSEKANEKLERLQRTGGKTNMQEALEKSLRLFQNLGSGARAGSFKRVLVVTDGQSNVKPNKTLLNAMDLKLNGAEIFVIGVGEYLDGIYELAHLASSLDAHLYRAGDMQGLVEVVKLVTPVSYRRSWESEVMKIRQAVILGRQ